MMKKNIAVGLILIGIAYGCAGAEKIKSWPQEKLYFSAYSSEDKKDMRRKEIVSRHPEWSEEIRQNVLKGDISPGMTSDQVTSSYGKALEMIGTTYNKTREHELWIYPKAYLIFDDGKLVSIEEVVKIELKPSLVEKARYGL